MENCFCVTIVWIYEEVGHRKVEVEAKATCRLCRSVVRQSGDTTNEIIEPFNS